MLDIKQIRYFAVLAETLHFGRAAARLNLSQPPLSRQIAALERELGVALFERSSRAVTLTRAGKSFQADAKAILDRTVREKRARRGTRRAGGACHWLHELRRLQCHAGLGSELRGGIPRGRP